MAETTVLRSSASPRNASTVNNSATPHTQLSSPLPLVIAMMGGVNGKSAVVQGQGTPARQGVVVMPLKGQASPNGFVGKVEILPPKASKPALSSDGLLLCRHLVVRFIDEQKAEGSTENAKLAEGTLAAIDQALNDATTAAALAAAAPPARRVVSAGPTSQVAAAAAPRRVPANRPTPPQAPIVDFDAGDVIDVPDAG